MKINGITGNSTASGFTGYFEVSQTGQTNTGCVSCVATLSNFTFQMPLSEATPQLQARLLSGAVIPSVDVVYRRSSGTGTPGNFVYYQVHLDNVRVLSVAEVGNESSGGTDQYQFDFSKIAWKYSPQNPTTGAAGTPVFTCYDKSTHVVSNASGCSTFPF